MRKFTLLFILFGFFATLSAQEISLPRGLRVNEKEQQEKKRAVKFFVGGNVNSNFGYNLALSPEIGIKPLNWLRLGVGPRYELSVGIANQRDRFATHAFGVGAFAEGTILNYIILRAGYEFLNYPYDIQLVPNHTNHSGFSIDCKRDYLHACSLGVGAQGTFGNNIRLYALYIIYPFLSDNEYYVPLPMFARIGISYDF